jgi:Phage minor capsid protein 2.
VADVENGHELMKRLAGTVAADEVVRVDVRRYSGHVWDLTTDQGWFVANGIVTHNCRPWEGKVLSISGNLRGRVELPSMVGEGTVVVDIAGSVDEARAAGLQHPNCTHSLRAFLPGATRRPARPTANAKGYEAKERQREIERQIRKWKEREAAALTDEAKAGAAAKVRAWQKAMRDHLAANPELKRLPYREQIGAGNLPR